MLKSRVKLIGNDQISNSTAITFNTNTHERTITHTHTHACNNNKINDGVALFAIGFDSGLFDIMCAYVDVKMRRIRILFFRI